MPITLFIHGLMVSFTEDGSSLSWTYFLFTAGGRLGIEGHWTLTLYTFRPKQMMKKTTPRLKWPKQNPSLTITKNAKSWPPIRSPLKIITMVKVLIPYPNWVLNTIQTEHMKKTRPLVTSGAINLFPCPGVNAFQAEADSAQQFLFNKGLVLRMSYSAE